MNAINETNRYIFRHVINIFVSGDMPAPNIYTKRKVDSARSGEAAPSDITTARLGNQVNARPIQWTKLIVYDSRIQRAHVSCLILQILQFFIYLVFFHIQQN